MSFIYAFGIYGILTNTLPFFFCLFCFLPFLAFFLHFFLKGVDSSGLPALRAFIMDKSLLGDQDKNSAIRHWSEVNQKVFGDSQPSERIVPGYTYVSLQQNDLYELKEIWESWEARVQNLFRENYGDIAQLIYVRLNQPLLRAAFQFWNPAFCCFTFNGNDLMPTIEEYTALINRRNVNKDWIYSKPPKSQNYHSKLSSLAGMSDAWAKGIIQVRGESIAFS